MTLEIRSVAGKDEIIAAFALVQQLAAHEGASDQLKISEAAFIDAASGPCPHLHILAAFDAGALIGIATYFKRFHIWNGTYILELDDLFVHPEARGKGVGTKLLTTLGKKAKDKGWAVKWQVNANNEKAIALYKRMGANYKTSGLCFWLPENI